jgi:DNA recombination protein RmuC
MGVALGAVGVGLLLRARTREVAARLVAAREELETAQAQRDANGARCTELTEEKLREVAALKEELAGVKATLEGTRAQVRTLTEAREDLLAQVGEKAAEVFDGRGKQLIELAKAQMKAVTTEAHADLEQREKAVTELVSPVQKQLKEMGEVMQRLDRDRVRTSAELLEKLTSVTDGQRELRLETGALTRALRQPNTRGRWGEFHLRRAAEMAGMTPYCDFVEQSHIDDDGKILRPDMVVRIPGDREVPVDAKAPLGPYLDACEAEDDETRRAHMELYSRGLRAHVKKLANKKYFEQLASPEFAVMYLPGEQYLGAALEADGELLDDAFRQRVVIATPTTLVALLWSVACGWQQAKVAEEARAIADLGRQLYNRLGVLLGHIDLVSKRVNSLVDAQNKVVGSLERRVLPTARRFPELGAVDTANQLDSVHAINLHASRVQVPELPAGDQPAGDGDEQPAPVEASNSAVDAAVTPMTERS